MIFLLGCYAVLMMSLLPGLICLKAMRLSANIFLSLPLCFALSLVFNYFMVLGLTLGHLYTQDVLFGVGFLEACLVLSFYRHSLVFTDLLTPLKNMTLAMRGAPPRTDTLLRLSYLILGIVTFYWLSSIGNVFGPWDPGVWYNHWAIEWSQNQLPTLTWHYPQLLPANWSIAYLLTGTHLEAFPASIQGFFFVGLLSLCLGCFYKTRESHYLLALLLIAVTVGYFYFIYLNTGYADIPVGFFNLAALLILLLDQREPKPSLKILILALILSAALTKPAGIYTAIVIPLLQFALNTKRNRQRSLCLHYLILTLLILPWYLYVSVYTSTEPGFQDIAFLVHGIFTETSGYFNMMRILLWGGPAFILLVFCWLLKEKLSPFLKLVLYAYTPYFFIWVALFSYDNRNLLILFPVLGLLNGYILTSLPLIQDLSQGTARILKKFPVFILPFIVAGILLPLSFNQSFQLPSLINHQNRAKDFSFDQDTGLNLVAYANYHGFDGKILTNFAYFTTLPILMPNIISFQDGDFESHMQPTAFQSLANLQAFMKTHPHIQYFFLYDNPHIQDALQSSDTDTAITNWTHSGQLTLEFSTSLTRLYQINRPLFSAS